MDSLFAYPSFAAPVAGQCFSRPPSIGILSTYPPTPCGLATFTAALSDGLSANGAEVSVVRIADGSPTSSSRVVGELINGSATSVAASSELLNQCDVAIIQHEYGIYGGADGEEVLDLIGGLHVPAIVVAHTILKNPTPHQRSVFEAIAARADQVVVMSEVANARLRLDFNIDRRKVTTIPHGATIPGRVSLKRSGRPTLLTWGLLGPGKGIERVIDVMGSLHDLPGRPRYLVAGRTHPKVLAADGEAYRDARAEQARSSGVADSVSFDPGYRGVASLVELVQSAAAVVLPYDSTDQVTSGVLVDAIACGRPVVATAFPHAIELLGTGAGIVVGHDDPDALAAALRRLLTDPRVAGSMAAEARRLAPTMAWTSVAKTYLSLARRHLVQRPAAV
ncbi:glycosyl transferase family 1 [Mycolicibacter minnesotensis]|uniref:Glycosyl transferase family 1 n=1 Tax=Mycolicibacter minnesotensis TaxID=1118379 RepID=A0A7I7R6G4_9MYCO|nr:glycosyltransferase [Mycolicibacter minnesotensis]ORB03940.1 glycosyl transferase family 1 [Mycolicibacter minnesotensis]BBY34249.1 glycosyl transferase family 1 [Mycolicibacter minnesotensis]